MCVRKEEERMIGIIVIQVELGLEVALLLFEFRAQMGTVSCGTG